MKTITIKQLIIENFKAFKKLEVTFGDSSTIISGRNGSGKSSVYDAYMWCIFGINHLGNKMGVQPYDEQNNLVHRLDTMVEAILDIDGERVSVKRLQREKWTTPSGQERQMLRGTVQERFINDVPCGVAEFENKLHSYADTEQWFILSSIQYFLTALKQDERRSILCDLSPEVDTEAILRKYPLIVDADLSELQRQCRYKRKSAEDTLKAIPAKINQQEKLRVEEDFAAIEADIAKRQSVLAAMRKRLEALETNDNGKSILMEQKSELLKQRTELIESIQAVYNKNVNAKVERMGECSLEISKLLRTISALQTEQVEAIAEKGKCEADIKALREQWIEENAKQFASSDNTTACPFCGKSYLPEEIDAKKKEEEAFFNESKLKKLASLEEEARKLKERMSLLTDTIEVSVKERAGYEVKLSQLQAEEAKLTEEYNKVQSVELALSANKEYTTLNDKIDELNRAIKMCRSVKDQEAIDLLKGDIKAQEEELVPLIKRLAGRDLNAKIDALTEEIRQEEKAALGVLNSIDAIEHQLRSYKKEYITAVEESVSSLFDVVRWKMYEPNVTNDGEKEICQAIINGVPYESQNTATRINAGIDIINGLSKAYEMRAPLFVDNKESVTNLLETSSQLVTMCVEATNELTIKTF